MSSTFADAFDQVHPDLVDLLIRLDLLPTEEGNGFSESNLARTIFLAIELADPDEQALLVTRIITEEEMAAERLRSPAVRNTSHRIVLDPEERKAAFLKDPLEPKPRSNGEDCTVCTESAHIQAPCSCNYCLPCYREALRIGLRSQEEFPPRCCQPFDEEAVSLAGSPALVHLFRQMEEEAGLPIPDRLYCHDGNCAAFIPPDRNGHCLLCPCITCVKCGARAHEGQPCAEGDIEEDVWATMDTNRTVNCPECGRMIQLAEACNHITCPCKYEFCFLCGQRWKGCGCPNHSGFDRMVPMRHRPGVKPPQFRRRVNRTEAPTSQDNGSVSLRIPQLRPNPREEERAPRSNFSTVRRVIRPLVLPQHEEAARERQREELRANEIRQWREAEEARRREMHPLEDEHFPFPAELDIPFPVPQAEDDLRHRHQDLEWDIMRPVGPPFIEPVAQQRPAPQRRDAPRSPVRPRPATVHRRAPRVPNPPILNEPQLVPHIHQAPVRTPGQFMGWVEDLAENQVGQVMFPYGLTANPVPILARRRGIEEQRQRNAGGGGVNVFPQLEGIARQMRGELRAMGEQMAELERAAQMTLPTGPPQGMQGAQAGRHHHHHHHHRYDDDGRH